MYEDENESSFSAPPRGEGVPTEARQATVLRVVYQKPGSDWKILKMDDDTTWVGDVGESTGKGSVVTADGHWEPAKNPRFPDNFVIDDIVNILPYSNSGLQTWLMDRLPDIGEERAKDLVKRFPGEELFQIIENDPEKLTAVRGITSERAQKISEAYETYKHELEIIPELVDLGIRYTLAQKALKKFGPDIKKVLNDDPFDLVDVDGWTFMLVKEFVLRPGNPYGMPWDDPRIIRAWGREVLENLKFGKLEDIGRDGGDCFMPGKPFMHFMQPYWSGHDQDRKAKYSAQDIGNIVRKSKHLVVHEDAIMLSYLDADEENVANIIRNKLQKPAVQGAVLVDNPERPLDPSQRTAAEALTSMSFVVMTGGPGTGKTTTLRVALDAMEKNGERVKLAAPTGKAAKRMSETTGRLAQTIHRMLKGSPEGWGHDENNPLDTDVIVLDETSMLQIDIASAVLSASGSARIILVGDDDQLPPVGPGQVLTDVMKAGNVPVFRLTRTHRQAADSWVIDNAKRIINGQAPSLKNQSDFEFVERRTPEAIIEAVVGIYVMARDKGYEKELQVLAPMKRPGRGASTPHLNDAVQKRLNPKSQNDRNPHVDAGDKYKLFEGDKIIYTKNNTQLGLVNGDMGYVEKIVEDENDTYVLASFEGLNNPKRKDGLFELRGKDILSTLLGYALTIHKSQGSEWKQVVIVADPAHGRVLRRQALYTGVTRTSRYLRIVGSRDAIYSAVGSPRQNQRWTKLSERLRDEPI